MLENEKLWVKSASEMIRALRGKRSQVAFSRWIGYRSNVAADWEGGHRSPTAATLLVVMSRLGVDVPAGFEQFHPGGSQDLAAGLFVWLESLRGHTSQAQIARRSGFSRHQVRRWLKGDAQPRLPQFLRLVHALTGRVHDWVAAFVDINQVPTLCAQHRAAQTASRLAYDHPWSAAVRVLINTDAYRADPTNDFLCRSLGISADELDVIITVLLQSGLVKQVRGHLRPLSAFTAAAHASDEDRRRLKAHWSQVATERLQAPRAADLVGLNLISLSRADLEQARQLQRDYFRALRGLVAASEPEEVAALVLMQIISLTPDEITSPR